MKNFILNRISPSTIFTRGLLCLSAAGLLGPASVKADIQDGFIHGYVFDNSYSDMTGSASGTACRTISISEDGFLGQAVLCNKGYVRLEDSHGTAFGIEDGDAGKMTILCWFNPTSTSTSERVLVSNSNWKSGKNPGVVLDAQYKGGPYYNIGDGSDRIDVNAKLSIPANEWQFTAITADLTTNEAYLYYGTANGTLQQMGSADLSKIDTLLSSYKWYIGEDYNDYYFYGLIDEVGFWDRALSFDEIDQIYTAQKAGTSLGEQVKLASSASTAQAGAYTDAATWTGGVIPKVDANVAINAAVTSAGRSFNGEAVVGENGSLSASGCVFVGHSIGADGKLTINGGKNVFSGNSTNGFSSALIIGFQGGAGEFVLNGGSVAVSGRTYIGYDAGGETSFVQTGGTYESTQNIYIGASAGNAASLSISEGTLSTSETIAIGTGTDSTALMKVSGGTVSAKNLQVGRAGAGESAKLTITGGVVKVSNAVYGSSSSASGNVAISGTGQLLLDSTYTHATLAGIRELTELNIEGSGDGNGAIRFLKSLDCSVPITLTDDAAVGIGSDAVFTQKAAFEETGSSVLTILGGGTLALSAQSSFSGGTVIDSSRVKLTGAGTLGAGTVTMRGNGALEVNAAENEEKSFTNQVAGTGQFLKTGAGTLNVDAAQGVEVSSLSVSEGRLNFQGNMTGDFLIADGAVFSPGNGIGTMTLDGDFTAKAGSQLVFELGEDVSDLLVLESGSTLDISEEAVLELLIADADPNRAYTLIEAEDGLGEYADTAFWTSLLTLPSDSDWELAVIGNTLQAVVGSADPSVPEPSAWILLLLGSFGLLYRRKK